jgi:DNA-binding transcriptional ArsR family regulator
MVRSSLDRAFQALADPTRRAVLVRLGSGPATIGELARPHGLTITGMSKHIRLLEQAGLVTTERVGRTRECSLGAGGLQAVHAWVGSHRRLLDGAV